MAEHDQIIRFLFEEHDVRGYWISLSDSLTEWTQHKSYPNPVKNQLFKAALATNLITETIKFDGRLTMQIQSGGDLSLLLLQADSQHHFRGVARHSDNIPETDDIKSLMPGAQMTITIEPNEGKRYQGIVPTHEHSLADNLTDYFQQSEQLPTRFFLFNGDKKAVGLFLQAMPSHTDENGFDHLVKLAETIKEEEALTLGPEELLHRLYHQDPLRLFEPKAIAYRCGCTREKSLASLTLVPKDEVEEILQSDGKVDITCEFCFQTYQFDSIDVEQIFANKGIDRQHNSTQ